jgi:NAD(P)-dependent dehydrogenase (short-subunit alcohol dehydrogenase family)
VNYVVHPEAAQAVAAEIAAAGATAITAQADVADAAQVARMFADVDRAWEGVDILVNNAGIDGPRAAGWDQNIDAWRRVLDINLTGAYLCAREALRRMVPARRGVVLNLTSVHERIPWTGYSAYTTSKAGLSMLTKTLAQEAAPSGVRVVALAPGAIQTPINRDVWSDPAQLQDLLTKIPMGRMGTVDEVARMVAILVSDAASYITGTTVFVDGGMTLYPSFIRGG